MFTTKQLSKQNNCPYEIHQDDIPKPGNGFVLLDNKEEVGRIFNNGSGLIIELNKENPSIALCCDLKITNVVIKGADKVGLNENLTYLNLTAKESICAYYLCQGLRTKEIANKMHRSPRTIEKQILSLKEKTQATNVNQLIRKLLNLHSDVR